MSSFAEVKRATCQVLKDDGRSHQGTAFAVLPDGVLLTCHHVIFGLSKIQVRLIGDPTIFEAEYLADQSDPASDIAVLRINVPTQAVQLGHIRDGVPAYSYGFRPRALTLEPEGHSNRGDLSPGQLLQFPIPEAIRKSITARPEAERQSWNTVPEQIRAGEVRNLTGAVGLEQGLSGGPVYDPMFRRVVGITRAVEGQEASYVIPLETVFRAWPDLQRINSEQVPDAPIDELERNYGIRPVAEGAQPIRTLGLRYFSELLKSHRVFGGRQEEIDRLTSFLASTPSGYFFVTSPPGFGKTALLANWVQQKFPNETHVVAHFLTRSVPGSTEAESCLENLCEQLSSFHGLGGQLPGQAKRLLPLYADLLQLEPPPNKRLLVVIDGLDEALGTWEPGPGMFPAELPENVHVVFSAREIADRDWLQSLNLTLPEGQILNLGRLDRNDIAAILESAHIPNLPPEQIPNVAEKLDTISSGDPFYVRDILRELERSYSGVESLEQFPVSHSQYLKQWWNQANIEDEAFVDLMGLLAAARGRLKDEQIANISNEDKLRSLNVDRVLQHAAQYMIGNQKNGYQLSHRRIQQFVESQLGEDMEIYLRRLADYCLRWDEKDLSEDSKEYIFTYAAHHLDDAGRYEELIDFISPAWMAAKWRRMGSYAGLIKDLDVAAEAALKRQPPDYRRIVALGVSRGTARTLTIELPEPLLTAMVKLGQGDQVIQMMKAERDISSERSSPTHGLRALEELIKQFESHNITTSQEDIVTLVFNRLGKVVARVQEFRSESEQVRFLREAFGILKHDLGDSTDERSLFLNDFHQYVSARLFEPATRCAALCLLAESARDTPEERGLRESAQKSAADLLETITGLEDYIAAQSYYLRLLNAQERWNTVRDIFNELRRRGMFQVSSELTDQPLSELLAVASLHGIADKDALKDLLVELGNYLIAVEHPPVDLLATVVNQLLAMDELKLAIGFLDQLRKRSPEIGSAVIFECIPVLSPIDREQAQSLFATAKQYLPASAVAVANMWLEDWAGVRAALDTVAPNDSADALLRVIQVLCKMGKKPAPHTLIEALAELAEATAGEAMTFVLGRLAECAAEVDPEVARLCLRKAIAGHLQQQLPAGDTDSFLYFLAIALHQDKRYAEAGEIVSQIVSLETRVNVLCDLIELGLREGVPETEVYDEALQTFLQEVGTSLPFEGLRRITDTLVTLRQQAPERTVRMDDVIKDHSQKLLQLLGPLFKRLQTEPSLLESLGKKNLQTLVLLAGKLIAIDPAAANVVKMVREIGGPDKLDRMPFEILYARATVTYYPDDAVHVAEQLLELISQASRSPNISGIMGVCGQLLADLSETKPEVASGLMRRLLDIVLSVDHPALFLLAIEEYWSALGLFPEQVISQHQTLWQMALDTSLTRLVDLRGVPALQAAAYTLSKFGELDAAQRAISAIPDENEKNVTEDNVLGTARRISELGPMTPLEKLYTTRGSGLPLVVLSGIRKTGQARSQLDTWERALANDLLLGNRRAILEAGVWTSLLPAVMVHGAGIIKETVHCLNEFDQRFVEAAKLIAEQQPLN